MSAPSLILSEEQESVRKTARELVRARAPIATFRRLRDENDPHGMSRALWSEMASLGIAGTSLPEAYGGNGLGLAELGLVVEECGRALAATPLLASVVLAGGAIALLGSDAQRAEALPPVARGDRLLALAHDEGRHYRRLHVTMRMSPSPRGHRLDGTKTFVLDGNVADAFVVSARSHGHPADREGVTLAVVPRDAEGVIVERRSLVDGRNVADVRFESVEVAEGAVLGAIGGAAVALETVLDRGAIVLAAEMLGGAREAFERTIAHLKERKQFGVPIGSFQALKHRAATLFCELELSTSIVLEALRAADAGRDDVSKLASVAKARLTDTYLAVTNEAVQMHGGIGVTDEHDIGLFLKRARVSEMLFGDAAFHRDRYATSCGY